MAILMPWQTTFLHMGVGCLQRTLTVCPLGTCSQSPDSTVFAEAEKGMLNGIKPAAANAKPAPSVPLLVTSTAETCS